MRRKWLYGLALSLAFVIPIPLRAEIVPTSAPANSSFRPSSAPLSLLEAMQMAMRQNNQVRLAGEKIKEAQSIKMQKTSGLLPHLSANASQYVETLNLAALGFTPEAFPGVTETTLGPFGVFDARIHLMQPLFDWAAIGDLQAGKANLRKAQLQEAFSKQQAGLQSALIYLELLRAQASARGNQTDIATAEKLIELIRDQNQSGLTTSIDTVRAETQLSTMKSLLIQSQTSESNTALRLKRVLGMNLATPLRLSDQLSQTLKKEVPLESVLARAQEKRLEIQVAKQEISLKQAEQRAAFGRQMPSIMAGANYGASGNRPDRNIDDTYQVGAALNVPLFDGGLTLGKISQAKSQTRQAEILLEDIQTQVEQDVRQAYRNLTQTKSQVLTAQQTYRLAQKELTLIQDQFRAGLGDSLALVTAENALTRAREELLAALATYHMSRLILAYSIGEMEGFQI